jgi:hypothetical protein
MRPALDTPDPVAVIERLDADAIVAELDRLYSREAALRAALKIARAMRRKAPRPATPRDGGRRDA